VRAKRRRLCNIFLPLRPRLRSRVLARECRCCVAVVCDQAPEDRDGSRARSPKPWRRNISSDRPAWTTAAKLLQTPSSAHNACFLRGELRARRRHDLGTGINLSLFSFNNNRTLGEQVGKLINEPSSFISFPTGGGIVSRNWAEGTILRCDPLKTRPAYDVYGKNGDCPTSLFLIQMRRNSRAKPVHSSKTK